MKKILAFLANDGSFLYEDFNCRITDSKYDSAFGGSGSVTLQNETVEIRFWLERDRVFMDMRARGRRGAQSWYSIDILKELLTRETTDNAAMNAENTSFLRQHFPQLMQQFSAPNLAKTESMCKNLERRRSARMFD